MPRLLEWFEVTPFVQKVSLVGLFLAISGVGFYWLIAEPLVFEIDIVVGELQTLDRTLNLKTTIESQLDHAQGKLSQWKVLAIRQEMRLGLEVPMSQVLSDMSKIAQETGIILTLWKPNDGGDHETSNQIKVRHLQLHVEGGYHHVAQFLDHMQYLSKAMGVMALSMHRAETGVGIPTMRAVVDLMGYEGIVHTLADNSHMPILAERMGG